jgi:hypothetical protein
MMATMITVYPDGTTYTTREISYLFALDRYDAFAGAASRRGTRSAEHTWPSEEWGADHGVDAAYDLGHYESLDTVLGGLHA